MLLMRQRLGLYIILVRLLCTQQSSLDLNDIYFGKRKVIVNNSKVNDRYGGIGHCQLIKYA
jgi:hypothetical protein